MTLYATDFSEYSTGSPPSDWSDFWNTGNFTANIESNAGSSSLIGNKQLSYQTTAADRSCLIWDDIGTVTDCDILVHIDAAASAFTSTSGPRLYARAGGTDGSESGYCLTLRSDKLVLFRQDGPLFESVPFSTLGEDRGYWLRFKLVGSSIKGKVWATDDIEPADWDIEVTDSTTASGKVGFGGYYTNVDYAVDYFTCATGADEVTYPPGGFNPSSFGTFDTSSSASTAANLTFQGGLFVPTGYKLTGASIRVGSTHTSQARLAVYSGGTLTDPEGATLLHDFGQTSGAVVNDWVTLMGADVEIPAGEPLWFAFKRSSGFPVLYSSKKVNAGCYQNVRGRSIVTGMSVDPTVAYESTVPNVSLNTGNYWFALRILLAETETPPAGTSARPVVFIAC